jgi:hypothetical protein
MPLGLMLILYLLTFYLLALWFLWRYIRRHETESPLGPEVPFALKEGQTIVGVGETTQGIDFYIGDYVMDEKYSD